MRRMRAESPPCNLRFPPTCTRRRPLRPCARMPRACWRNSRHRAVVMGDERSSCSRSTRPTKAAHGVRGVAILGRRGLVRASHVAAGVSKSDDDCRRRFAERLTAPTTARAPLRHFEERRFDRNGASSSRPVSSAAYLQADADAPPENGRYALTAFPRTVMVEENRGPGLPAEPDQAAPNRYAQAVMSEACGEWGTVASSICSIRYGRRFSRLVAGKSRSSVWLAPARRARSTRSGSTKTEIAAPGMDAAAHFTTRSTADRETRFAKGMVSHPR